MKTNKLSAKRSARILSVVLTVALLLGLSQTGLFAPQEVYAASSVRYVKQGGAGTGDGSSWANASGSLQAMIDASSEGDRVFVAAGTYDPTRSTINVPTAERTFSFLLKSGVKVYGGFAGTEASLAQRDLSEGHKSVLSGAAKNSYHVIWATETNSETVLDGFTVSGGNADQSSSGNDGQGGGIRVTGGAPAFVNLIISGNYGTQGGGMYADSGSSATFANILFTGNTADTGGGMFVNNAPVTIVNSTITDNEATGSVTDGNGGSIYKVGGNVAQVRNSILWGNTAGTQYIQYNINIAYTNCVIEGGLSASPNATDCGGNKTSDPKFVSASDFSLQADSPAIDAGSNAFYHAAVYGSIDLAGNMRIHSTAVDIGVYEYGSSPPVIDRTPPALTVGTFRRTSDTAAVIGFTADEGGTAYYLVVNSGDTTPSKETVKAGTSLSSVAAGVVSNKSVVLTAGAKDIYVVCEDEAGNISAPLKIAVAAWKDYSTYITYTANSLIYTGSELTQNENATLAAGAAAGANPVWTYSYVADGTVSPNNASLGSNGKPVNAGSYILTIKYEDDNGSGTKTVAFTVGKANQSAPPVPTLHGKTEKNIYIVNGIGENYECAANTVNTVPVGGWYTSSASDSINFTSQTPNTTYYIFSRLKEDANHNASPVSAPLTVTTNKAALSGTVTISGTAKYGQTLTADVSGLKTNVSGYTDTGALSYQWVRQGTTPVGTNSSAYTLTTDDIGYGITVNVMAANCTGGVTGDPLGMTAKADAPADVNLTYDVVKNRAQEYSFDLTTLLPVVSPLTMGTVSYYPSITTDTDGVLDSGAFSYTSGNTLTLPVGFANAGEAATVTVLIFSKNYNAFTATITVNVIDKAPVTISGVTMAGGTYNGGVFTYTGTPVIKTNTDQSVVSGIVLDALYESTDGGGYSSSVAPKNAGAYKLTLSVPAGNTSYTGSKMYTFTIMPKAITVKADDKSAKVGESQPVYTYTVTGLVGGDTLQVTPNVFCPLVDMNTPGTYPIAILGKGAGANYTVTYLNGVLTVMASETLPDVTPDVVPGVVPDVQKIRTPMKTIYVKAKDRKSVALPYVLDTAGGKPIQDPGLTVTSGNTKIVKAMKSGATVKIQGLKKGKATVTIKARNGRTCQVKVIVVEKALKLQKFTVKAPKKLKTGKSYQLQVSKLTNKKATDIYKIKFASSNKKVLTVDAAGKVTATGKGKAKITVTLGTKKIVKAIAVS